MKDQDNLYDRDRIRRDNRIFDDRFTRDENILKKIGEYMGREAKSYRRPDDHVQQDCSDRLWSHSEINAGDVKIQVKDGVVTLTGTVTESDLKVKITNELEHVHGVRDVINRVREL